MIEAITHLVDSREARTMQAERDFKERITLAERDFDEDCLREFLVVLKDKMNESRDKGRSGWWTCAPGYLRTMLEDHVKKGDPRDVAIIAMMLWALEIPTHVA